MSHPHFIPFLKIYDNSIGSLFELSILRVHKSQSGAIFDDFRLQELATVRHHRRKEKERAVRWTGEDPGASGVGVPDVGGHVVKNYRLTGSKASHVT